MIPFRAKKHRHEGMVFDSTAELARWQELRLLERAGEIYDLQHHPKFELIVNGEKIAVYTADSGYYRKGVQGRVIDDVKSKGTMTPEASLRIRLFQALYRIEVTLVGKNVPNVRKFRRAA